MEDRNRGEQDMKIKKGYLSIYLSIYIYIYLSISISIYIYIKIARQIGRDKGIFIFLSLISKTIIILQDIKRRKRIKMSLH